MSDFNHIYIEGRASEYPYSPLGNPIPQNRTIGNRSAHGNRLKENFNNAVETFSRGNEDFDFVFIEFESARGFEIDLKRFEDSNDNMKVVSCKTLKEVIMGVEHISYVIVVSLNKVAVTSFLEKIEQYLNENTPSGNPKQLGLVANIEDIRAATLRSFWQEGYTDFPEDNLNTWWEVWFTSSSFTDTELFEKLIELELDHGSRILRFPEHCVVLIKGTPVQLSETLLYLNSLNELRKPLETADFFTNLDSSWENSFIDDLKSRIIDAIESSDISICLLDSGVNRANPLLEQYINETHLDSVNPYWTNSDEIRNGHGTPMAGLILYGDLTNLLQTDFPVTLNNTIESVKIIGPQSNDPELYGQITLEAISRGELMNPSNKRIVCMAVTAPSKAYLGKPSSWSAAIDQKLFGSQDSRNNETIILVSSGNMQLESDTYRNYPLSNDDAPVQDPGQSFNSVTVGAFTRKNQIDQSVFPNSQALAHSGSMAPCNTTSILWEKSWARKPELVMEGGNVGLQNNSIIDPESLKLLSTGPGGIGRNWLTSFGDTSAATALGAKLCGDIYSKYPELRPETIRALLVHSADWTSEMLNNREINELSREEMINLISRVGYGVPNKKKALYSAENSLTIIAEKEIQPYKYESNRVKANEFHLFDLPWPTDVLTELAETEVIMKVTLSYFIEPNPGNKVYSNAASYRSHGLRFKMIDRAESEENFKARISRIQRDNFENYIAEGGENWILGAQIRDKGSIHKDIWKGTAADLALRNKIAIHPVGGWWKNRKKLNRYLSVSSYSIIISIETPSIENDIYTSVSNQINIPISVENV